MLSIEQVEIIKKVNNFIELAKNYPEIVFLIKKHKIKEFYPDRYREQLGIDFWTNDLILIYGKLCRTKTEFKILFKIGFDLSVKRNLINDIMKDKIEGIENIRKYTKDGLLQLCRDKNIKTYHEFRTKYPSPYQQAYQQNLLEDIKSFFKELHKLTIPTDEEIVAKIKNKEWKLSDALVREYFKFFPEVKENVHFLLSFKPKKRGDGTKKRQKITKEFVMDIAKGYSSRHLFRTDHPLLYSFARNNAFLTEVYAHMSSDPSDWDRSHWSDSLKNKRYSEEEIRNNAKKYYTRKEFSLKDPGAYNAAIRKGILDKVCSHMKKPPESLGEQLVRKAFNYHFNKIFYKIRPEWLVNPKTGLCLELDGYNDELNIAFEVNGGHHYNSIYQDVKIMEFKDDYKKKMCKKHGIKLYVFEYKKELERLIRELHKEFKIPIDWLKNVALDLRGKLTSKEITKYRNLLKLSPNESVQQVSYEEFANYINILRKQNLSNNKIIQILKITKAHLSHRILRIHKLSIPIINR